MEAVLFSIKLAEMTPTYIWLVKNEYERQLADNNISMRLIHVTRATLREECIDLYNKRLTAGDKEALLLFFEVDEEKLLNKIKKCHLDTFKTLNNFLIGETIEPNYKVVEVAAWLINFEHRPYNPYVDYEELRRKIEEEAIKKDADDGKKKTSPSNSNAPTATTIKENLFSPKRIAIALSLITALGSSLYLLGKQNSLTGNPTTVAGCMYWAGDHYEPLPCDQKVRGKIVIALDSQKLTEFKKINTPDTITYASIGWVWYHKPKRDSVEYYTADGWHPIDLTRRLKPITKYMIDKHILSKK